ncbi:MAG: four helix bundle protein [Pyrinomonadaceae bacterium]|nr:four helix bundle protein [Pyrinomonadaceae bacterium]
MGKTNFEKLRVYQLSEKLADQVWEIVLGWNFFARITVGRQLVSDADSVGANISEGAGRGRFLDNKRFVRIARGSMNETQHWLRRAYKRSLLTDQQVGNLKPVIEELAPTLNAYLKSIGDVAGKSSGTRGTTSAKSS